MDVNGIYKAIITDNTDFFETGKVKVRVSKLINTEISWDLVNNYNKEKYYNEKFYDADAFVSTSIGGDGAGVFSVPQINTVGMVQFLNGNIHTPIWTGSFYSPVKNEAGDVLKIPIPDDDYLNDTGAGAVRNGNDSTVTKRMKGNNATVIFRQKKTKLPNNSSDNMNWDKQRTSNLIVVDEDEILITHFSEWKVVDGISKAERYEQIKIGLDEFGEQIIKSQIITEGSGDAKKTMGLEITKDESKLKYEDEKTTDKYSMMVNSDGVVLTAKNDNKEESTRVEVTPADIFFENKDTTLTIDKKEMILNAKGKVKIGGGEIQLGDGGGYVITVDPDGLTGGMPMFAIKTEDGHTLKACPIRA